ncbi:MAG: hypothetical protein WD010_07445 [Nitriliruptor sp.]|uniref:hypothetical protein n=1 Tax=Nitriliruptor sp. TaxID=2448056 RepID=UPI00349FE461
MKQLRPTSLPVRILASLTSLALVAGACTSSPSAGDLEFAGPEDDALVNAAELEELTFSVASTGEDGYPVDELRILLDGDDVTGDAAIDGRTLTYAPGELPDGGRSVVVAEVDEDADASGEPDAVHE